MSLKTNLKTNESQYGCKSWSDRNILLYNIIKYAKETEVFKILIETSFDLNAKDKNGNTPLHRTTDISVMKIFICAGADPNIQNNNGDTPLHLSKDIEITNILLCAGADPHIKNNDGNIPLINKDIIFSLNQYK